MIAALHSVDYAAVGLGDYGKPGRYIERQVARWTQQYRASETETIDAMERLIEWLPEAHSRRRGDRHRARRFPARQRDIPSARTENPGGARLGAVDIGPSSRRPGLSVHALPFVGRTIPGSRRIGSGGAADSERSRVRGRLLPAARPRAGRAAGLDLLPGLQHVPPDGDFARCAGARPAGQCVERNGIGSGPPREAAGGTGLGLGASDHSTPAVKHEGAPSMDFSHSDKVRLLQERLQRFMDAHIYPAEPLFDEEMEKNRARRQSLAAHRDHGGAEAQGEGGEPVESVPAALRARRRALQSRVRAPVRDHGALASRARGLQLLRARHRQHGSAGPLRHARAAGPLAGAAARGADPFGLRHDRARCGLERRHEYPVLHRARRRSLRDQRPQVVDLRRRRSALRNPDLHGQDRSGRGASQPAVDDSRAHGHAGRQAAAPADRVRLRSRAARPRADRFRRRARAGAESFCSARGAASKSRRAAWDPAAFITACA